MNMLSTAALCALLSCSAMFLQGCCTPGFHVPLIDRDVPAFHIPLTALCKKVTAGYCGSGYIHGEGGGDKYSSLSECAAGCDELEACATYNWCPEETDGCSGQWNKNGCWFFPEGHCHEDSMMLNYAGGGYVAYEKFSLEKVSTGAEGFSLPTLVVPFLMSMVAMGGVVAGIMRFRTRLSAMEVVSMEDAEDAEEALCE